MVPHATTGEGAMCLLLSTVAYAEEKGGEDLTDFSDYILPQFMKLPRMCRWDVVQKQAGTHARAAKRLPTQRPARLGQAQRARDESVAHGDPTLTRSLQARRGIKQPAAPDMSSAADMPGAVPGIPWLLKESTEKSAGEERSLRRPDPAKEPSGNSHQGRLAPALAKSPAKQTLARPCL